MQFTYYGHSCFSVNINDKVILFDPFITPNELAKSIDITTISCNYIAISHAHADHIADAVTLAKQTNATIICAFEVYEWLAKQNLSNFRPMNTGGKWTTDFGTIKCVSAIHSSGLPDGSYGGNPMGFVVKNETFGSFYYAGDTALTLDMQLIPDFALLNFAILPIGDNFTMDVDDAITAAKLCKVDKVIGVHFDTFPYIVIDHETAKDKFKAANIELILPEIGKTIEI